MTDLNHRQRAGLRMIANGHRPRQATLEALKRHGLIEGPFSQPRLTAAGEHTERTGELRRG